MNAGIAIEIKKSTIVAGKCESRSEEKNAREKQISFQEFQL